MNTKMTMAMRPWHKRLLALTVALAACGSACGRQESTASGPTGGGSTSAGQTIAIARR